MRLLGSILSILLAASVVHGDCGPWNVERLEAGMFEHEAASVARIGTPMPVHVSGPGRKSIYRSTSVRARDKSWKGKARFKHGRLTRFTLVRPGTLESVVAAMAANLGDPEWVGKNAVFRNPECNTRIVVEPDRKGARVTLSAIREPTRKKNSSPGPPRLPGFDP